MAPTAVHADGRVLRGERTRTAILDALLELLEEGEDRPRAKAIAERAEVSVRSVFQHFDDLDALNAAVADRQAERLADLVAAPPAHGSLDERIDALISQRSRLFERIAPVRRATVRSGAAAIPAVVDRRDDLDRLLRSQLLDQFGPELRSLPRRERDDLVSALDGATSFGHWEHLRSAGLSTAAVRRVTRTTVAALLHQPSLPTRSEERP